MSSRDPYVPVFMDSAGYAEDLGMSRFTYFFIECDEPGELATPFGGELDLPFLLMDLEGVIFSPLGGSGEFDSPEAISTLLDHIDRQTPYVVSTSYIWLPNDILARHLDRELRRGDVIRIAAPLFVRASRHTRTPAARAFDDLIELERALFFSPRETAAFQKWTDLTIERVRRRHHGKPEHNLAVRMKGKEA